MAAKTAAAGYYTADAARGAAASVSCAAAAAAAAMAATAMAVAAAVAATVAATGEVTAADGASVGQTKRKKREGGGRFRIVGMGPRRSAGAGARASRTP